MIFYVDPKEQLALQKFSKFFDSSLNFEIEPGRGWGMAKSSYYCEAVRIRRMRGTRLWGESCHPQRRAAVMGAMGEALERNSQGFLKPDVFSKSFADLKSEKLRALDPESYRTFHPDQPCFKSGELTAVSRETPIDWCWFEDMQNGGAPILIPSEFACWSSFPKLYYRANSNGTGGGLNRIDARLSAISELLERDAIMFYWWTRNSPRKIVLDESNERLRRIQDLIRRRDMAVDFFHAKTDLKVNVIMATVRSHLARREPFFAVSGSCRLDPIDAIERAFAELLQVLHNFDRKFVDQETVHYGHEFENTVWDFADHTFLYACQKMPIVDQVYFQEHDTIHSSKLKNFDPGSQLDRIAHIESELRRNGCRIFYRDMTANWVRYAGFYVERCVSPDLIPIEPEHRWRSLGHFRLYRLAQKLKLKNQPKSFTELNTYPHPFP